MCIAGWRLEARVEARGELPKSPLGLGELEEVYVHVHVIMSHDERALERGVYLVQRELYRIVTFVVELMF